jgi:dCMP deaminase
MWYEMLPVIAAQSHCSRAQVAAILTDTSFERLIAFGYNGNYRGGPNQCDVEGVPGGCGCIHAEANALAKQRFENPKVLFCTYTPCLNCAKLVVNSGIESVYAIKKYRASDESLKIFDRVGIFYSQLEVDDDGYYPGYYESHSRLSDDAHSSIITDASKENNHGF